jgi:serine beta-lactamase-like protein LACTB
VCSAAATPTLTDYGEAMRRLEQTIHAELARGLITGVTVALVDDQRLVYAKGFGYADKRRRAPARPDTVYRAGSISKLFTALAAMQLVEEAKLELDAPVTQFDPAFRIVNPFPDSKPITLRQLMCHRSGMIRESPVGSYFDPTEPGTERTVRGVAPCALVYPPDTKTKYSNVGPTLVGHTVARVAGVSFEDYQQRHLLDPIGMNSSGFLLNRSLKQRLATGYMPVADGRDGFREIEAPSFELGTIPAGNLYTTADDLARFLSFLFAGGRAGEKQLLKPETLAEMFTPQLTKDTNGFGLGFFVGNFRGHKTISHTGAVYGFTSALTALPEEKLGVVVLINDDIAVGPMRKLNNAALEVMLEARLGEKPPAPKPLLKFTSAELSAFAGEYESESFWAKIEPGEAGLRANVSGQRMDFSPVEPMKFEANGRVLHEGAVVFERDEAGRVTGFTALNQKFRRVEPPAAGDIPAEWRKFLGSYGPAFIPVIISVKHGRLYAMTENEFDYRLTPLNRTVFKMPPGLYVDEQLVFQVGRDGRVHSILLANMELKRRTK